MILRILVTALPLVARAPALQDEAATRPSAPLLRDSDRAEIRARFRLGDRDRSDWISYREARSILGLDRDAFRRFDADGDGAVSVDEFDARCRSLLQAGGALPGPFAGRAPRAARVRRASPLPAWIAGLDPDANGEIALADVLERLEGSRGARAALADADRDSDGSLDRSELAALGLAAPPPAD